jgi:hypothetical protein
VAVDHSGTISQAELRLAARNHGMPLEALAYDVTPAGMHYLLTTTTCRWWIRPASA